MKKGIALLIALAFCLSLVTIAGAEVSKGTASSAGSALSASSSSSPKVAMVKKTKKRPHRKGKGKKVAAVTKVESSGTK